MTTLPPLASLVTYETGDPKYRSTAIVVEYKGRNSVWLDFTSGPWKGERLWAYIQWLECAQEPPQ